MNFKIGDKIVNVFDTYCIDFPIGAVANVINVRPDLQGNPQYLEFIDLGGDVRVRAAKDYKIASIDDEIQHVQKQEKRLLAQKEEEEEKKVPKVGAKYQLADSRCNWDGSVWMIAYIGEKYCLICIEHNDSRRIGDAWEHKMFDRINDVFGLYSHLFTKL